MILDPKQPSLDEGTKKRINLLAKSGLAKLMAIENLQVVHDPSKKTAMFDLKDRIVYLPMLKEMTGYMYDAFIAHEIAHAIFTPVAGLEKALKQVPHAFINITEDARIEKLIQRRYPGTVSDFIQFYEELSSPSRDFFGLQDLGKNPITGAPITLDQLGLIDRINLHFKIGKNVDIPFAKDEQKFVDMVAGEETWEDAVDAAKAIYDFMKQKGQCTEVTIVFDGASGDPQDQQCDQGNDAEPNKEEKPSDNLQPGEKQDESANGAFNEIKAGLQDAIGQQKAKENDSKSQDKPNETKAGEDKDGGNESAKAADQASGNQPDGLIVTIKVGHTQDKFEKSTDSLVVVDTPGDTWKFGDVADASEVYKSWITPLDKIVQKMAMSEADKAQAVIEYQQFLKEISPTVNMMVNQFNMRKSADDYKKIEISKTGELDMDSISLYRIQDDIFRRSEVVPENRNHGMVMFIDWSGSMESHIKSTVKQLIILTEFCMKVGIPFDVYAFTTGNGGKHISMKSKDIFAQQGCSLYHLLTSRMKKADYRNVCAHILKHTITDMDSVVKSGMTPMTHAAFLSEYIIQDFKRITKVQKVAVILLSDGAPTDNIYSAASNIVMRDPTNGKNYTFKSGKQAFHDIFGYVRDKTKITNLIGMYITPIMRTGDAQFLCPNPLKPLNEQAYVNEFREKKYVALPKAKNFDKFFVISVNNFEIDKTDYLKDVTAHTSDNAVKSALEKQLQRISKSMIFMKLFIEQIS